MSSSEIRRRRKYGQVFLTNPEIASFEVSRIPPGSKSILEIGAGAGFLTEKILEMGYSVTAVEPDHVYADMLRNRFSNEIASQVLQVVQEDFMRIEHSSYDCILGNIPYFLTSKIIFRLFDYKFTRAVLMVQKEFADKAAAEPGSRSAGRLSYSIRLRGKVSYLRTVPKVFFDPVPEVDSAIIQLTPAGDRKGVDPFADQILRIIFTSRRKKLSSLFQNIPVAFENRRGETLTMSEFLELCTVLRKSFPDPSRP